ncbi:hypothetical protein [Alkalibaculum sporogenes]|uniref:hypothetical protein n=1 Tax=Alkalibaculum sporogenes TaxID=2655001 RepID=UPI001A9C1994|nr:hypothetical protein [Alkalibaculum sporogenes]
MNKSEMARRFNCDPRTIHRYLEIESGELVPNPTNTKYISKLDDYKAIIIDKVDKYGATANGEGILVKLPTLNLKLLLLKCRKSFCFF